MERIVTVTTPATDVLLTTLSAVADAGSITGSQDNAFLSRLIAQASAAIGSHLNRVPAREVVSETIRRTGTRQPEALLLARAPVVSIGSITEDGVALGSTDWELQPDTGMLRRLTNDGRSYWSGLKTVIAYTAGWILPASPSPTLPGDIERACIVTVLAWYQARDRDPALRSESADGISAQSWLDPRVADGALPWSAAALLAPYVRPSI